MPEERADRKLCRCLIFLIAPQRTSASGLEIAQVGDAGFQHVEVHFDKVVYYAAGFCGGEDFPPIERVRHQRSSMIFVAQVGVFHFANYAMDGQASEMRSRRSQIGERQSHV